MPRAATLADSMRTCVVMSVILYFPIFALHVTAIFPQFTKIGAQGREKENGKQLISLTPLTGGRLSP